MKSGKSGEDFPLFKYPASPKSGKQAQQSGIFLVSSPEIHSRRK